MRLSQDFGEGVGVRKLITSIPVRKPGPQDFVRVHPDPDYRMNVGIIELRDDREAYLVLSNVVAAVQSEFYYATLYAAINRQGVTFLWPVRSPSPDGRQSEWQRSATEAAELAMKRWVRVKANMALGAYEIFEASSLIPDPEWPSLPFRELSNCFQRSRRRQSRPSRAQAPARRVTAMLGRFREIWAVDFEFSAPPGERPSPVCLAPGAQEPPNNQIVGR